MLNKLLRGLTAGCALLLTTAIPVLPQGDIFVKAAPSGPDVTTTSTSFVDIPHLSINFIQYHAGAVSIGMSAECETTDGKRMFVRALVDGQPAKPSDIVLSSAGFSGVNSFVFETQLDNGLHDVTMQYMIDGGGTAALGDRTMWIMTSPATGFTVPAPSGPLETTTSGGFADIPHLVKTVELVETQDIVVTLTAEAYTSGSSRMFVRAIIDGQAATPSDVVFAVGAYIGTHSMTFVAPNMSPGQHEVKMQWKVDAGSTAFIGDRTMTIQRSFQQALNQNIGSVLSKSAPSGPVVETTSSSFSTIPDMVLNTHIPDKSAVRVSLTCECYISDPQRMFVRAVIDDQPMLPSDVLFKVGSLTGTNEFTFVQDNVAGGQHQIALQWQVDGGGTASMGDRNITLTAFPKQSLIVDVPNGGEKWEAETPHIIVWRTEGIANNVRLGYSVDGGASFMPIAEPVPNTGTYHWTVPATPSATCLVRVSDEVDDAPADVSDAFFEISGTEDITLDVPNGGEEWNAGTSHFIVWHTHLFNDPVRIEFSDDGGAAFHTVADHVPNSGSFEWVIPFIPSPNCFIKISDANDGFPWDIGDAAFTILPATRISQHESAAINNFNLYQNYPNPFNPSTRISFDVKEPSHVRLTVLDASGRTVRTLTNTLYESGRYSINFSQDDLAAGIYFYKIQMGDFTCVKKMVLLR